MADIFSTTETTETTGNPVELLVGEGKKFKTIEDLAKSKLESDAFIETLKGELLQVRTELSTRTSVEDQIKNLAPKVPPAAATPNQAQGDVKAPVITEDDLNERIRRTLAETSKENIAKTNIEYVADTLVELYGSTEKAQEQVTKVAAELGVSKKFLMDSAATSPKAFFKTMGVSEPSRTNPATRSDVNTEAFRKAQNTSTSTFAPGSYEEARTRQIAQSNGNPVKALLDPAYLNATMKAALENPDKFLAA